MSEWIKAVDIADLTISRWWKLAQSGKSQDEEITTLKKQGWKGYVPLLVFLYLASGAVAVAMYGSAYQQIVKEVLEKVALIGVVAPDSRPALETCHEISLNPEFYRSNVAKRIFFEDTATFAIVSFLVPALFAVGFKVLRWFISCRRLGFLGRFLGPIPEETGFSNAAGGLIAGSSYLVFLGLARGMGKAGELAMAPFLAEPCRSLNNYLLAAHAQPALIVAIGAMILVGILLALRQLRGLALACETKRLTTLLAFPLGSLAVATPCVLIGVTYVAIFGDIQSVAAAFRFLRFGR